MPSLDHRGYTTSSKRPQQRNNCEDYTLPSAVFNSKKKKKDRATCGANKNALLVRGREDQAERELITANTLWPKE